MPIPPELTVPIDESGTSEDGSSDMRPPRISAVAFDDDDVTQHSMEFGRRDIAIKDRERMSFGNVRLSENFNDLTQLGVFSDAGDLTALQQGNDEDTEDVSLGPAGFGGG